MTAEIKKIEEILGSGFSMDNYVALIGEIFSSAEMVAPYKKQREFSNFSSHIAGYSHVANYETPDDEKMIIVAVELQKNSYVENARSTQRSYAKKLIESSSSDAAVVAFYTEGDPKWRLSFVRLDYEMKFENGKLKAVENITPAKRYSFLVGADEPSHTAIDRLYLFISDKHSNPTLDDLEEVFSVEKVTKEFFDLYCEKYHQLREHLLTNEDFLAESEKCGFTVEQFAKKLMGQIVFLYFLQKKGWLGVGAWPSSLTEKEYKDVFYTKGAQGRLIKEYLPQVYVQKDEEFVFRPAALYVIPNDAEELIANNLPQAKAKNWGEGSKHFLRTLFDFFQRRGGNFHNDYLEPLFYDALNKNRGPMGYSPLLHCRIPFLSGGLFEPINGYDWKVSDFCIPDEIFSNRIDNDPRTGDGILDIFDRYNFTMSEDEPMEREVAIDPEMLGKVFENLLDVTDRKSKGAFYTPREIVHYMCQESLINYLTTATGLVEQDIRDFILYGDFMKDEDTVKEKRLGNGAMYISEEIFKIDEEGNVVVNRLNDIDNALADIRIADPAVGSGAFPVGMLNEIVRARQNLTEYLAVAERTKATSEKHAGFLVRELRQGRSAYDLKWYAIKNSIFAADIEPSAVDIAQLRLWLSLVIDDEINPNATSILEGHCNPLPLPNLECNILCGNSLVDEFEGYPLLGINAEIGTSEEGSEYSWAQSEFDAVIPKILATQDAIFVCDDPIKKSQLLEELSALKDNAIETQLTYMAPDVHERYEESKTLASKPYILWQLEFARVFRDKGGFDVVIGNPPYIQLQKSINDDSGEKLGDQYKDSGFETFTKTGDIYCLFYEKGYKILHHGAVLSFITSNKWMRASYGEHLRGFFSSKVNPIYLVDFAGQKVFESATVDVNILIFTKQKNKHNTMACIVRDACLDNLSVYIRQNGSYVSFNDNVAWIILSPIEQSIKQKIEQYGTPLRDWNISINYGIKTGFNDAFIINGSKKDELIAADPKSAEIIRPILRGRDIKRYRYNFDNLWLINIHNGIKEKNIPPVDVNDYPAIKTHLDKSYEKLVKRADKGDTPYNLRNCAYMNDFYKQKIVWGEISDKPKFAIDLDGNYVTEATAFFMVGAHLKYLLCFLNSTVSEYFFAKYGTTTGMGTLRWKKYLIGLLPVPKVSSNFEKEITSILDKLLLSNSEDEKDYYLSAINKEIYQLLELTEEEILFIEETIKNGAH